MPGRTFLGASIAVALVGCSSVHIRSAPDPPPTLHGYRTYSWISREPIRRERAGSAPGAMEAWVRNPVDCQLQAKGYQRAFRAPDFLVAYDLSFEEKTAESFRDLYSYHRAGGKAGIQNAFAQGFEEVVLTLEIIDARTRRLLWRASAAAVLGPEGGRDRIAEAVRSLGQRLPAATSD